MLTVVIRLLMFWCVDDSKGGEKRKGLESSEIGGNNKKEKRRKKREKREKNVDIMQGKEQQQGYMEETCVDATAGGGAEASVGQ